MPKPVRKLIIMAVNMYNGPLVPNVGQPSPNLLVLGVNRHHER